MTARLLTITDLAERLGVSEDWAYRLSARGDIATTRVGRHVRFTEEAYAEYVARCSAASRSSRKGTAA